ncbi:ARM repeat-containing protein [Delitschia confertaspora ATCC 74209]|uniref:ARM repeat-containing protein n=1 Tax=Delitschia confertaspora ATCC 74209 TaxID=1513339 RepID=A0A9P4JVI3_9PLEO|nr:ARM repeat-containing protein [Delitschia confertaspora ATCC 74209]
MSVNISSDGSPTPRKSSTRFSTAEDLMADTSPEVMGSAVGTRALYRPHEASQMRALRPLLTSNLQGLKRPNSTSQEKLNSSSFMQQQTEVPRIANRQTSFKKYEGANGDETYSLADALMHRLDQQQAGIELPQKVMPFGEMDNGNVNSALRDYDTSSTGSVPITPAAENFSTAGTTDSEPPVVLVDAHAMLQMKKDLDDARNEVARMKQELHATSITTSTLNQAISQTSDADYDYKGDVTEQTISRLQNALNASTRPGAGRQEGWTMPEDTLSDNSEGVATKPLPVNGPAAIWGNGTRPAAGFSSAVPVVQPYPAVMNNWNNDVSRPFYNANMNMGMGMNNQTFGPIQQPRPANGHSSYRARNQLLNEPTHFPLDQGYRGGMTPNPPSRPGSAFDGARYNQYTGYPNALIAMNGSGNMSPTMGQMAMGPLGMYNGGQGQPGAMYPRPGSAGTRLSPEAAEFSVDCMAPTPWNAQVGSPSISELNQTMADLDITQPMSDSSVQYVAPVEPMNYRRLLDRNMNCNWKYIVDKIICNNDQQASIFLQQKLKVGTTEQKYDIVEAIIAQAYPLMINRFGNFLVQRCFEHGTPEQIVAIAYAIRGNTLTLSMDAFGCHVIQKAFDAVPEEYKATMVHELLRRIPETVIHRYACHVWQKLFELRWSDSPPQIMRYVNEALRGMWHEVALGETGSLVVQNIFENCLEEDKRPCINEVLASIDVIARGQFGNWCIQHICEHGATADRSRAIEHILRLATEYSMDQYASKVIEKCLKIGGNEFLDRYLERVCEGRSDRPRMPLIDIAGDQFGNYLIQYILTNSATHHRELVATHIRKHMVSLRGSKYGSRVAMLCCNPAVATRPGPPVGLQLGRYSSGTHSTHRNGGAYGAYR